MGSEKGKLVSRVLCVCEWKISYRTVMEGSHGVVRRICGVFRFFFLMRGIEVYLSRAWRDRETLLTVEREGC